MRRTVASRRFAPPTLGVRRLDTNAGNRLPGEAIRKGINPYGAARGGPMELQCPNCKSKSSRRYLLLTKRGFSV